MIYRCKGSCATKTNFGEERVHIQYIETADK